MRLFTSLLLLLAIPLLLPAQKKEMKKFFRKYKHVDNAIGFTVPGFVIKMGAGVAKAFVDDPNAKAALKFAKRFKRVRFLVMENQNPIQPAEIKYLVKGIKSGNSPYDDFITVRDGNTRVVFMIREKKDFIKNMFILVSEDNEFVMLDLKSKFKIEHLNELLQQFSEEMDVDIPIKTPTPKPKAKLPRV